MKKDMRTKENDKEEEIINNKKKNANRKKMGQKTN